MVNYLDVQYGSNNGTDFTLLDYILIYYVFNIEELFTVLKCTGDNGFVLNNKGVGC